MAEAQPLKNGISDITCGELLSSQRRTASPSRYRDLFHGLGQGWHDRVTTLSFANASFFERMLCHMWAGTFSILGISFEGPLVFCLPSNSAAILWQTGHDMVHAHGVSIFCKPSWLSKTYLYMYGQEFVLEVCFVHWPLTVVKASALPLLSVFFS